MIRLFRQSRKLFDKAGEIMFYCGG